MNFEHFDKIKNRIGYQVGIHGKNEFFNSVVMVLLIAVEGEYHLVFQKRASQIRQGGEICFPGGKVDLEDASLEAVAIRETEEEMGIPRDRIEIIGRLDTMLTPGGVAVDAFIGIADVTIEDIKINRSEVESFFTIPVTFFMKNEPTRYSADVKIHPEYINQETGEMVTLLPAKELGLPERYWKPWGNYRHTIYVYQTEYGVIWGITSRLIYDFVDRIKNL